jgi:hypothetical protein
MVPPSQRGRAGPGRRGGRPARHRGVLRGRRRASGDGPFAPGPVARDGHDARLPVPRRGRGHGVHARGLGAARPALRAVPRRRAHRRGRDGDRVPRRARRRVLRPSGGRQGPQGNAGGRGEPAALRPGAASAGPARAPGHLRAARRRHHRRRPGLHRHGARRGRAAEPVAAGAPYRDGQRRAGAHRAAGAGRAAHARVRGGRVRTPGRRRPPRPQAHQHPRPARRARRAGAPEGHRFRHRARHRLGPDDVPLGRIPPAGHAPVHGPRADRRQRLGRARGRTCTRWV